MEKILDKLSTYNIFNYLVPGVVFCVISDRYMSIPLLQDSIITGLFLYYFVGLVISRIGSIVMEPIFRKTGVVKFADYSDFIKAAKTDPKIELLSESNNMYRTIFSALVVLCFVGIGKQLIQIYPGFFYFLKYSILPALIFLFALSYKKQTEYITKRISASKSSSE